MKALNSERRRYWRARGGKEGRVSKEITYYPPLTNLEFISEREDANDFKIERRGDSIIAKSQRGTLLFKEVDLIQLM